MKFSGVLYLMALHSSRLDIHHLTNNRSKQRDTKFGDKAWINHLDGVTDWPWTGFTICFFIYFRLGLARAVQSDCGAASRWPMYVYMHDDGKVKTYGHFSVVYSGRYAERYWSPDLHILSFLRTLGPGAIHMIVV